MLFWLFFSSFFFSSPSLLVLDPSFHIHICFGPSPVENSRLHVACALDACRFAEYKHSSVWWCCHSHNSSSQCFPNDNYDVELCSLLSAFRCFATPACIHICVCVNADATMTYFVCRLFFLISSFCSCTQYLISANLSLPHQLGKSDRSQIITMYLNSIECRVNENRLSNILWKSVGLKLDGLTW